MTRFVPERLVRQIPGRMYGFVDIRNTIQQWFGRAMIRQGRCQGQLERLFQEKSGKAIWILSIRILNRLILLCQRRYALQNTKKMAQLWRGRRQTGRKKGQAEKIIFRQRSYLKKQNMP